jgi:hypothetical protein
VCVCVCVLSAYAGQVASKGALSAAVNWYFSAWAMLVRQAWIFGHLRYSWKLTPHVPWEFNSWRDLTCWKYFCRWKRLPSWTQADCCAYSDNCHSDDALIQFGEGHACSMQQPMLHQTWNHCIWNKHHLTRALQYNNNFEPFHAWPTPLQCYAHAVVLTRWPHNVLYAQARTSQPWLYIKVLTQIMKYIVFNGHCSCEWWRTLYVNSQVNLQNHNISN